MGSLIIISDIFMILMAIDTVLCNEEYYEKGSVQRKLPFEALKTQHSNRVVSTLALRFSLCKLASVADNDTKTELLVALGLSKNAKVQTCYKQLEEIFKNLYEVDFVFVNKMYVNYTDDVDSNFIKNSSETYGVQVDKVGFNYPKYAASFINKWFDSATYKRITDIVDHSDIALDPSILLISAAYLKTTWEFGFDIRLTKNTRFHLFDKKNSFIPMMTKTESYMYFHDTTNHLKILNIKLGSWGTSVTFIVPQDIQGLPELLKKFSKDPKLLKSLQDKMRYTLTKVVLPRFKIKSICDWTDLLQKFASKRIFNKTYSGLNGMLNKDSKIKNVFISKAKQKNFVELDEMGVFRHIEALRIPFVPATKAPSGPNVQEFVADRPFYFSINLHANMDEQYELFQGVFFGTEL